MEESGKISSGARTKAEIAREYNIDRRTLYNWLQHPKHKAALEAMGLRPSSHLFPPIAVQYIYEHFGEP